MNDREDLKAFVDGELNEARTKEIRAALANDPALQQEVAFMKLLGDAVREEAEVFEVKGADKALQEVRKSPRAQLLRRMDWRLASGLLSIVAIGLIVGVRSSSGSLVGTEPSPAGASSVAELAKAPSPTMGKTQAGLAQKMAAGGSGFGRRGANDGVQNGTSEGDSDIDNDKRTNGDFTITTTVPKANGVLTPEGKARVAQPQLLTPQSNRKVIQNGSLDLQVDDVVAAQANATMIAKSVGGFVESSNLSYADTSNSSASLTLRVPAMSFDTVLARLEGLGKVMNNNRTGQDVTAEYADTDARLKELGAEEDSYVTMLRGARSIGQILEIKDRLSQVRQDIESYHEQMAALKDQSTLSTITLTLNHKPRAAVKAAPKPARSSWAEDTWSTATSGFKSVVKFVAECVIFIFVYSPIWLPLMIIGWYANKRTKG